MLLFASAVATWAAAARAKSFRSAKALAACSAERAAGCGARRAKETLAKMSCAGPRTSCDEALHIVKRLEKEKEIKDMIYDIDVFIFILIFLFI